MISKWSIVGYIFGIIYTLIALVKYAILEPTTSNIILISNIIIGLLICSVSWLYSENLNKGNTLLAIEDYLADHK